MKKSNEELEPWLMPSDTVEAIELMEETAEFLRSMASFASLRKELRSRFANQALKLDEFAKRLDRGVIDKSIMIGIDEMARAKRTTGGSLAEIVAALEEHVSTYNRR